MSLWIAGLVPVLLVFFWFTERWFAHRTYEPMPHWSLWGLIFVVSTSVVGTVTPWLLGAMGMSASMWPQAIAWGAWGYPAGVLATSLAYYGWHRLEHASDRFWRWSHQLHHSPRRVDTAGAFYAHPVEVAVKTSIGLLMTTVLLGLDSLTASLVLATLTGLSLFQHWNINTPQWLGWILPRPEMHACHHERDVHARNYSDLPLWDLVFGTYFNPPEFRGSVGFDQDKALRVGDMLMMRDVHRSEHRPACCAFRSG